MKIQGKGLDKIIQVQLDKYQVELGILKNEPKKLPIYGQFKTYAGQQLLRAGKQTKGTLVDVAVDLDNRYKWLRRPFIEEKNKEVAQVVNDIVKAMNGKADRQRVLNGMQAIIRNPILRGDYGRNSPKTAQEKGFNKLLMATGQFFKAIKARYLKNV